MKPPSDPVAAVSARQRIILRSAPFTVPLTLVVLGAAYYLLPPLRGLADSSERLVLAAKWLVIAMLPYVLVCATIATNRFREGSHDPLAGAESTSLKVHCRVMQNTLEQLVWFGICLFAFAGMAAAHEARLVPIASVMFVGARLLYWRGYLRAGTLGRAPGVQATFTLNGALLVLTLAMFVR